MTGNVRLASALQVAAGMRQTMLLLGLFAIAGCHAQPCGGCPAYETCDVAANECVLNAGTRFDLVANDGEVPGSDWDPFFGPPDPYICASAGGAEACTTPQSDDSTPRWNQQLLADLDGDALLVVPIALRYEDSDVDSPDLICDGGVTVTRQMLHDGGFRFRCGNGAYARFSLENVDRGTPTVVR